MRFLLFEAAGMPYALETAAITAVVPFVRLQPPGGSAHPALAVMRYRGGPVTVVDLSLLFGSLPCPRLFSSRIILMPYQTTAGKHAIIGLLAEKVTEIIDCQPPADRKGAGRYLPHTAGTMPRDQEEKLIQILDLAEMVLPLITVNSPHAS